MLEMCRAKGLRSRRGGEGEWQGGAPDPNIRGHLRREGGKERGADHRAALWKSQPATGVPERRQTLEAPALLKWPCPVIGQKQPGTA